MLGAKQVGRYWPCVLDVAVSNPIRNIYAQILGFVPVYVPWIPRILFRIDCELVGSLLASPGLNSCLVVSSNRALWVDWAVLLVGEGDELR